MQITPGKFDSNFSRGIQLLQSSFDQKCNIFLFPELWTSGYPLHTPEYLSEVNIIFINHLQTIATEHQIYIGGTYLLKDENTFRNRFLLISPDQKTRGVYDKIHLFKQLKEDQVFTPGEKTVAYSINKDIIGFSICYDLRFPELYRSLTEVQATLFLLSAEWPKNRIEHWNTLVRARAVENQAYIAAVNSVGSSRNIIMGGNSLAVDPWGNILCQADETEEIVMYAEIDSAKQLVYRQEFTALQDRRNDIFQ